jgi:predicted O-methyltransferase YrrM
MPHKKPFVELIKSKLNYTLPMRGIEIGCLKGELDKELLTEFLNLKMTTIEINPQYAEILENNKEHMNRLTILNLNSNDAYKVLKGQYDFIFIDGDHSYDQCKADILNYWQFIKPGGLLSGHNYHKDPTTAHPGVHESVDEIFGKRVNLIPDFTWYVQI